MSTPLSTKLILEFASEIGKRRYTFSALNTAIGEPKLRSIANALNSLQAEEFTALYRIDESELA